MDVMKKILNELKTYLDNASPEELKQAWKEVEQFENVGPTVKDFTKQYQNVAKSDWFMKSHQNKSDGCVKETETKPAVFSEKKPAAWSDEDEENLQHCCMAISVDSLHTREDKQDMEAWLKRLKDRIGG